MAAELLAELGMERFGVMNIFLRQCVMRGELFFEVENPKYKPEVIDSMEEAERIRRDSGTQKYNSFSEAMEDLDSWCAN